jgi:hypothetical protein
MISHRIIAITAGGLALLGGIAIAQAAVSARVRGVVTAITSTEISVATRSGAAENFTLTPQTHFLGESAGAMSDIQSGSYIGSAAIPLAGDGDKLRALEVTVFPPSMVGVGEGHYDWDLGRNSSMTNGTVGDLVTSNSNTMTVKYKGGEKTIVVPADVPIVTIAPGAAAEVQKGVKVIVVPAKGEPQIAAAVLFGRDGITPPQ